MLTRARAPVAALACQPRAHGTCRKTEPVERPTFESLVFRLEDFFTSGEANYTDPKDFVDESEEPSKPAAEETTNVRMEQPEDAASDDDTTVDGGDGAAE